MKSNLLFIVMFLIGFSYQEQQTSHSCFTVTRSFSSSSKTRQMEEYRHAPSLPKPRTEQPPEPSREQPSKPSTEQKGLHKPTFPKLSATTPLDDYSATLPSITYVDTDPPKSPEPILHEPPTPQPASASASPVGYTLPVRPIPVRGVAPFLHPITSSPK